MNLGFIGLGIMGRPMALNLLRAGHRLFVYGRRSASMTPLVQAGCVACTNASQVAAQSEVIFIMVSDTPDVEQVLFGADGVAQGVQAGAVVVDMSTISPSATRRFAVALQAQEVEMLDAPVSGGDVGAINGSLSIMVGGKQDVFERVQPLFAVLGKNIVHVGDHGAGQVAKACNQIVVALTIEGVAEALTFARQNAVDPVKVRAALMGGFAASRILEVHGQRMLDDNYTPGFKTKLHHKDLQIVMQTAAELGLNLPGAQLSLQHLAALMDADAGELDSAAIMQVVQRLSEN